MQTTFLSQLVQFNMIHCFMCDDTWHCQFTYSRRVATFCSNCVGETFSAAEKVTSGKQDIEKLNLWHVCLICDSWWYRHLGTLASTFVDESIPKLEPQTARPKDLEDSAKPAVHFQSWSSSVLSFLIVNDCIGGRQGSNVTKRLKFKFPMEWNKSINALMLKPITRKVSAATWQRKCSETRSHHPSVPTSMQSQSVPHSTKTQCTKKMPKVTPESPGQPRNSDTTHTKKCKRTLKPIPTSQKPGKQWENPFLGSRRPFPYKFLKNIEWRRCR